MKGSAADHDKMALPTDRSSDTTPGPSTVPEPAQDTTAGMWLSHHWPQDHAERCVLIGKTPVCRRCLALYPLGLLVAVLSALGHPPWPMTWDPAAIWILCVPPTVAFIGEVLGLFPYNRRWQIGTTLLAALAYGRALGYEFNERWSPEFWEPIAVFGGLWFFAAFYGFRNRN